MLLALCVGLATAAVAQQFIIEDPPKKSLPQRVILIRHGEKPASGDDLSPRGYERADCLAKHFGRDSVYNISHIFAYVDHPSRRPIETATPLAGALGIAIDTSIKRDDTDKLADAISDLDPSSTVLVCWEHTVLHDVAKALGIHQAERTQDPHTHHARGNTLGAT